MPGQEDRQADVDTNAVGGPRRDEVDVRVCVESDCISGYDRRSGGRKRQVDDRLSTGRRQGNLGQGQYPEHLLVASDYQRRWSRTTRRSHGWAGVRTESAEWRSAVAGSLQGRLRDQRGYASMVSWKLAIRLRRIWRGGKDDSPRA